MNDRFKFYLKKICLQNTKRLVATIMESYRLVFLYARKILH